MCLYLNLLNLLERESSSLAERKIERERGTNFKRGERKYDFGREKERAERVRGRERESRVIFILTSLDKFVGRIKTRLEPFG